MVVSERIYSRFNKKRDIYLLIRYSKGVGVTRTEVLGGEIQSPRHEGTVEGDGRIEGEVAHYPVTWQGGCQRL